MPSTSYPDFYLSPEETLQFTMAAGVKGNSNIMETKFIDRQHENVNLYDNNNNNNTNSNNQTENGDNRIDQKKNKNIDNNQNKFMNFLQIKSNDYKIVKCLKKYLRFVGPGLMVSVAYMDPGNYATDVSAGASQKYSLLFIVLLSNIIAIFLQSLCIKLGSITGLDLSRACKQYLPTWLNYLLWFFAECAIVATDVAEVIGTAIALNILLKIPLSAGIIISVIDVLFVLMAYRPGSSLNFVRLFEYFVALLVLVVVICFCLELAYLNDINYRELFRGFAPSKEMFQGTGMYTAVSVLGATVMPHSLFLGSGLVQPRLREFDMENGYYKLNQDEDIEEAYFNYKPTLKAIKYAMKYSVIELTITLFTFALFVNSAILIVSASSLYGTDAATDASLYTIHNLLSTQVTKAAGTIFMVALLFSGQSAGIVCTIAGQIVSEGHLNWNIKPWKRRIITRSISILPCLMISLCIGKNGLDEALNASQVVLSILLPFLTAPLIYFTSKKSIMKLEITQNDLQLQNFNESNEEILGSTWEQEQEQDQANERNYIDMSNNLVTTVIASLIWLFISVLNIYMIVQVGINKGLN
ncbi:hypothetical protein WICMUC_000063 [Wickerhamomyces mucosus]|uniref:Manganese transporter n=1 Tax=Wickerhamomyces mucosus TaxID=1378264 RepID=A0A9P8Q0E6_9ASCO|nr:hypothetical protein WICMUC_000063 [Wickerhamomyces mucosus]